MKVSGLFSGIGGFELAFSQAGFEPLMLVEIDPDCLAVLKARFPNSDLREDVAELGYIAPNTTVLTAGFPCQNLSMAGDKKGIAGPKSGVLSKMFRVIERSRVPFVVIENVYFMLHLGRGEAMRRLVDRFEELGYKWAYRVLDTMGFGLPQRRRRVYFVASLEVDPRCVLFADEDPRPPTAVKAELNVESPLGFYWTEGRSGVGFTVDGIPPLKVGSGRGIPSAPAVLFPDGEVLVPSLAVCEQLQGFDCDWTTIEPNHGTKVKAQWRMVGNSVSIPVAQWIAERIKSPGTVMDFEQLALNELRRWPSAAWNAGQGRIGIKASDRPVAIACPSISAYRDRTWKPLSDRALNGFIKRAVEGGLRMPTGFLDALGAARGALAVQ